MRGFAEIWNTRRVLMTTLKILYYVLIFNHKYFLHLNTLYAII